MSTAVSRIYFQYFFEYRECLVIFIFLLVKSSQKIEDEKIVWEAFRKLFKMAQGFFILVQVTQSLNTTQFLSFMKSKSRNHFIEQIELFLVLLIIAVQKLYTFIILLFIRELFDQVFHGFGGLVDFFILQVSIGYPEIVPRIGFIIGKGE